MDDCFLHYYAFALYFVAICMETIYIRMIKTTSNTRLDPTGNNAGLFLAQSGCPGGSCRALTPK
jgi:hypothetical protein